MVICLERENEETEEFVRRIYEERSGSDRKRWTMQ